MEKQSTYPDSEFESAETLVVWFSHKEYRYDAQLKNNQRVFTWSNNPEMWDWNNCTVSAASMQEGRIRVIIRSTHTLYSSYMKKDVVIRYMYGFDVAEIPEPELGSYGEPSPKNIPNKQYGQEKQRWAIHLRKDKKDDKDNKDCWIWEWADGRKKEDTTVYKIYQMLRRKKENPDFKRSEIFRTPTLTNEGIIPVVYQPAMDSWKNFVREIHCHKLDNNDNYEVTIIMNGEQLRKHRIFEWIYRLIRKDLYHRLQDVETFRILSRHDEPQNFMFSGIYSNNHNVEDDDIHGDRPWFFGKIPVHKIKYFFSSRRHPIVFINTSNHAMAEHDSNHNLWKWEYLPCESDCPVIRGNKSREEIEQAFRKMNEPLLTTDVSQELDLR